VPWPLWTASYIASLEVTMPATDTSINLLMREGAVCVTFTPALDATAYDQLLYAVAEVEVVDELEAHMSILAKRWERTVAIERC
jgi:hypothetical protein